ncbi:hypothetical protein [Pseudomonas virus PBPA162]|uniref:Uncharacterized protein n=2 Tax=Iggyvirus TaxID=3044738 RepID=A0A7S5AYT6_9CAUD|nr:hypothetical protein PQC31_gp05 [Pseudomonas phage Iggy]YP_010671812.1 hypothetical protein PQC32_gp49 [Pseudomonas virus PBPA162]QDB70883.1 hypothetical protein [Pseudomonas virus PBPA162]QEA09726.1 hypothetical protein [Pseudomonas phage Iggy]
MNKFQIFNVDISYLELGQTFAVRLPVGFRIADLIVDDEARLRIFGEYAANETRVGIRKLAIVVPGSTLGDNYKYLMSAILGGTAVGGWYEVLEPKNPMEDAIPMVSTPYGE